MSVPETAATLTMTPPSFFWQSYFFGWCLWFVVAIGCLGLVLVFHMAGGRWGKTLRPLIEAGAQTLPWWGFLFLPIVFNLDRFYAWAHPNLVAANHVMEHRHVYFNPTFFLIRAAIYWAYWAWMAPQVVRWGKENSPALKKAGTLGLLFYVFTVSFASFDWMMSLDAIWGSSIYGMLVITGAALSALSFCVIRLYQREKQGLVPNLDVQGLHDVGNLMFAFTLLWTYAMLSQYLIIWYANLPEEVGWYKLRAHGPWGVMAGLLMVTQFALPFFLLLARRNKRNLSSLVKIAVWIFVVRIVNVFWMIMPDFRKTGLSLHAYDFLIPAAMGIIWLMIYFRYERRS